MPKIGNSRHSDILFRNMKVITKRIGQKKKKSFKSASSQRGEIWAITPTLSNIIPFLRPEQSEEIKAQPIWSTMAPTMMGNILEN